MGYRFGKLAIVGGADIGGGAGTEVAELEGVKPGKVRTSDVGAGVAVFPVSADVVIDPMLALKIGHTRTHYETTLSEGGGSLAETVSRGGFRFSAGLGFYAGRRLRLGPRLDLTLPFAGKVCVSGRAVYDTCSTVHDAVEIGLRTSQLPVNWAFTFDIQLVLGPKPSE